MVQQEQSALGKGQTTRINISEAMAMEEGVTFAWDVGVRDVVFEYDSKIVFDALNGFSEPPVSIANVIDRI